MARQSYFTPAVFTFLKDVAANNNREWWEDNKDRYISVVREPAKEFIADFGVRLQAMSDHFVADTRTNGGSLMRPYRDTRFSKDKHGQTARPSCRGVQLVDRAGERTFEEGPDQCGRHRGRRHDHGKPSDPARYRRFGSCTCRLHDESDDECCHGDDDREQTVSPRMILVADSPNDRICRQYQCPGCGDHTTARC